MRDLAIKWKESITENRSELSGLLNWLLMIVILLTSIGWTVNFPNYIILSHFIGNTLLFLLLLNLFLNGKKIKIDLSYWAFAGLLILVVFIGVHSAVRFDLAEIKSKLDIKLALLAVLFFHLFHTNLKQFFECFLVLVVLVFVLMALPITLAELHVGVMSYHSGVSERDLTSSIRLSYFVHLRHFTYFGFVASAFSYILFRVYGTSNVERVVYCALFIICFLSLLLSYGRGGILSFLFFVFLLELAISGIWRACIRSALFIVCIVGFYFALLYTAYEDIPTYMNNQISDVGDYVDQERTSAAITKLSTGRTEVWKYSVERALEKPVFGHGTGSGVWLYSGTRHGWAAQPHNTPIQWLMDYGFVGLFLILLLLLKFFGVHIIHFMRVLISTGVHKIEPTHVAIMSFMGGYFLYSLTDGLFYHSQPMLIFFLTCMFLAVQHEQRK